MKMNKFPQQVNNKVVLVRTDFNVSLEEGEVVDSYRMEQTIPTIKKLVEEEAKVVLMSHLGRPLRSDESKYEFSLQPLVSKLEELLGQEVIFVEDCIGPKVKRRVDGLKKGQVMLLENVRFYKGERENDSGFAQKLADLADIYINDAFGVSHRAHASVEAVTNYLPSYPGLSMQKEINELKAVINDPDRPLSIIIGGSKVKTKVKALKPLLEQADHLLLGGMIANMILRAKGISINKPLPKEEVAQEIDALDLTSNKLHLPVDVVVSPTESGDVYTKQAAPGTIKKKEKILDIGPDTIEMFNEIINESAMVVWNGPLGVFEKEDFAQGTKQVGEATVESEAYSIAGGGDTSAALLKFDLRSKFDHVSVGGGAMLEFLTGQELPAIKALNDD
ncbi:MAG: phosphoglycerate kinase [Candidatus Paceibacterota bacterium]